MESVFEFQSYYLFLNELVKYREIRGKTRVALASAMGCQAAYLSQVLNQKADLTEDHVAKLCENLSLSNLETEYLLVLLRKEKAGTEALKNHLQKRLNEILEQQNKIESRLSSQKISGDEERLKNYYSASWQASLIHLATSCESLRSAPAIAKRFNFDKELVEYHLHQLEKFNLVAFENQEWLFKGTSVHFPKGSPQDVQFQLSRRLMVMNSMGMSVNSDLHYSVIFSSTPQTYKKLYTRFLKLIEELHKEVEPTDSEDVFSVCIDLFKP